MNRDNYIGLTMGADHFRSFGDPKGNQQIPVGRYAFGVGYGIKMSMPEVTTEGWSCERPLQKSECVPKVAFFGNSVLEHSEAVNRRSATPF